MTSSRCSETAVLAQWKQICHILILYLSVLVFLTRLKPLFYIYNRENLNHIIMNALYCIGMGYLSCHIYGTMSCAVDLKNIATTVRILFPECIRSNASLILISLTLWQTNLSTLRSCLGTHQQV